MLKKIEWRGRLNLYTLLVSVFFVRSIRATSKFYMIIYFCCSIKKKLENIVICKQMYLIWLFFFLIAIIYFIVCIPEMQDSLNTFEKNFQGSIEVKNSIKEESKMSTNFIKEKETDLKKPSLEKRGFLIWWHDCIFYVEDSKDQNK